jgi:hypothetical protein
MSNILDKYFSIPFPNKNPPGWGGFLFEDYYIEAEAFTFSIP